MGVLDQDDQTLDEAQSLIQIAMSRMEGEFRQLLEDYSESVDPDWLFDPLANPSVVPLMETKTGQVMFTDSFEGEQEVPSKRPPLGPLFIDLLPSEVIPTLMNIAVCMVQSGYEMECCQAYIQVRKPILEESVSRLGMERFSIDDLQKMPREILEAEILRWMKALSVSVRILFPSEKQLCEKIFANRSLSENCFEQIGRGSMAQFLDFAEAVAIGRRSVEKLPRILEMYESLRDLLDNIESIFSGASCSKLRREASSVLCRLGESARGTFIEFATLIRKNTSRNALPGGTVHPLTRYVMNYLRLLLCFTNTLNEILGNRRENNCFMRADEGTNIRVPHDDGEGEHQDESLISTQVVHLIELLEINLDGKADLYRDSNLRNFFLMNNFQYIVQKVKDSEICRQLSDGWMRRHMGKVRQFHKSYLIGAWQKVIACLRDDGTHSGSEGGFSRGSSKSVLKDKFKQFNDTFEEVVKTQQSWIVSDPHLRADLRISIVELVVPAYRAFLTRYRSHLESEKNSDRVLKYSVEDLECILNDLFEEGSISHRRSSFS
ncbi:hypothetical protein KP509_16G058700 [Ceratopteris richardii]|nr:hypothetical protein KP509_16G058700 [Ceratopteris richardii]